MRRQGRIAALAALCALAGGCAQSRTGQCEPGVAALDDWRVMATPADRERLRGWRAAWMEALPRARAADAAAVAAGGVLFDPDRALDAPMPPPGAYRCRTFKLGAVGTATRDFADHGAARCRVEANGDTVRLAQLDGRQRPVGRILPDTDARAVFIGTLLLAEERAPLTYGTDARRDMVGAVERVGEARWRIALPRPGFESMLDVIELVADGADTSAPGLASAPVGGRLGRCSA